MYAIATMYLIRQPAACTVLSSTKAILNPPCPTLRPDISTLHRHGILELRHGFQDEAFVSSEDGIPLDSAGMRMLQSE